MKACLQVYDNLWLEAVKKMKKKIWLAVAVIAFAAIISGLYFDFSSTKVKTGEKTVTVQIVIQNKKESFTYKTSRSYLSELIEDKRNDLKPETKKGQYGEFVTGILGIKANESKEYYNIKVDGKDATAGISKIVLESGKTYTFTLTPL